MGRKVFTDERKKEILNHAKEHGPAATARKFEISQASLRSWNQEFEIYAQRKKREFDDDKKKEILSYVKEHGIIKASRDFNIDSNTILYWNKKFKEYEEKTQRKFTEDKKKEILYYARRHGNTQAAKFFGINRTLLTDWNKLLAVYNFKPTDYNEDLILKILDFTKTHGIVEATKEFDVSSAFILRWNKIYKIYEEKIYREFTEEQRKELLGKAKNIYDSLPEFNRSAALAFNDISQIYDINIGLLYNWNRNYRIVPTLKKSREKRKITQEEINAVKLALENSGGSKFAISRQTGISVGMIKRIFDEILQYDK